MSPSREFHPKFCQWPLAAASHAWRVPYRRVKGYHKAFDAVISLEIRECGGRCAYPQTVSFVIDTGTDVTIVPRKSLDKNAFAPTFRTVNREVAGLTGGRATGPSFQAVLSIPSGCGFKPFDFGKVEIVVVDNWMGHGMLGLNALRRVLMLSDQRHVYLQEALPAAVSLPTRLAP
jgi:hypothetical protein